MIAMMAQAYSANNGKRVEKAEAARMLRIVRDTLTGQFEQNVPIGGDKAILTEYGLTVPVMLHRLPPGVTVSKLSAPSLLAILARQVGCPVLAQMEQGRYYIKFQDEPVLQPLQLPELVRLNDLRRRRIFSEYRKLAYAVPFGTMLHPENTRQYKEVWYSLADMPHLLVAGQTEAGKSTFMRGALLSLCKQHPPVQLRVAVIDIKRVDFAVFDGLPHLWLDRARFKEEAAALLANVDAERQRREALMEGRATKLADFNERFPEEAMPRLLVVIDEVAADDIGEKAVEFVTLLARLGRASGIHLMVGTQHPTRDVLRPQVTKNLPVRVALRVTSFEASSLILGETGAEKLPKVKGRALVKLNDLPTEVQLPYLSDDELAIQVQHIINRDGQHIAETEAEAPAVHTPLPVDNPSKLVQTGVCSVDASGASKSDHSSQPGRMMPIPEYPSLRAAMLAIYGGDGGRNRTERKTAIQQMIRRGEILIVPE